MVVRIAEAVARERLERELAVVGRDGIQAEAARGGRELFQADAQILHVFQLGDAHERFIELLECIGQLAAEARIEVVRLLVARNKARNIVRLDEVGQLAEQRIELVEPAQRVCTVGRVVHAVLERLTHRVVLGIGHGEEFGALGIDRIDGGIDRCGGIAGVGGEQCAVAIIFVLIQQELEQHLEVADLAGPLVTRHMQQVAVGKLAERLEQGAGVERAEKELAVKDLRLPEILVFIVAEAGALAQDAAGREHLGRLADDELHLLGAVRADGHPVEVHRLLQVARKEAEVLIEHELLERDLLVVVFADVEIAVINAQIAGRGARALGVDAEGVLRTVGLVADDRRPRPCRGVVPVAGAVAAHDGERAHIVAHARGGRAGAHGDVETVVILDHLPDAAAVDAVDKVHGRIVTEIGLRGDLREALGRVVADEQVAAVNADVADDELAVIDRHAADAGADALFVCLHVLLHVFKPRVDAPEAIVRRVDFIDARQADAAVGGHAAAEIDLILIENGVAEQRRDAVEGVGHDQLDLPGVDVDLDKDAVGNTAVLLTVEKRAVKDGVELGAHDLLVKLVPHDAVHGREGLAHGGVARADIDIVAVGHGRPGVALSAVALTVRSGDRAGHGNRAIAGIVHDAVRRAGRFVRVRDLAECVVSGVVSIRSLGLRGVHRQCRNHQAHSHGRNQQQGQEPARAGFHKMSSSQKLMHM